MKYAKFSIPDITRNSLNNIRILLKDTKSLIQRFKRFLLFFLCFLITFITLTYVYSLVTSGKGLKESLNIGIIDSTTEYNPLLTNRIDTTVNEFVFNPLFTLDSKNTPHPLLANSWELKNSNTEITLNLTPNVLWQDGYKFNADDVIYSFNIRKKLNPEALISKMNIKKVDDLTVTINVPNYDVNIWEELHWPIFPQHTISNKYSEVGTGPYIFIKSENNKIYLKSNPTYFKGQPKIEDIQIFMFPSQETLLNAYQGGLINVVETVDPSKDIISESKAQNTSSYFAPMDTIYNGIFFNQKIIGDINIRKAINYAINKNLMASELDQKVTLMNGPINPNSWAYSGDASIQRYQFSRDNAMDAFQKAGYIYANGKLLDKNGKQLTYKLSYQKNSPNNFVINEIAKELNSYGLLITLDANDSNTWKDKIIKNKDYDIVYLQIQSSVDPDPYSLWVTGSDINLYNYSNKTVDRSLDLGRNYLNIDDRKAAYFRFQKFLMNDAPAVFIYSPYNALLTKPNIYNVQINSGLAFEENVFDNIQAWTMK